MKKRNKGFTLIELLAVIVILAIIALIAVPVVLKVIDNAERKAFENSAYGVIEAVKLAYTEDVANEKSTLEKTYQFPNNDLKLSGERPKGGNVSINENGEISIAIYDKKQKYCAIKNKNEEKVTVKDFKGSICDSGAPLPDLNKKITKIDPGANDTYKAILYLDPTDLSKTCTEAEVVSTTGTKTGCMKWYVYEDSSDNYKAILDHNTTATTNGWDASKTQINTDTNGWDNNLGARLITADEVAHAVGISSWNGSSEIDFETFDGASGKGSNKYAWLFDYTHQCTYYGCNYETNAPNVSDPVILGYWTSTADGGTSAWHVDSNGGVYTYAKEDFSQNDVNTPFVGVRPVITVSKAIVK